MCGESERAGAKHTEQMAIQIASSATLFLLTSRFGMLSGVVRPARRGQCSEAGFFSCNESLDHLVQDAPPN